MGGYATGKTTLALEFPGVYLYDADNNLGGAIRRAQLRGITFKYDNGFFEDDGTTNVPAPQRYTRMVERMKIAFADPSIKTVVADSGSGISEFIQEYVMIKGGKSEMTRDLWGPYLTRWKMFISWARSQKKTFILTVHEDYVKDELTGALNWEVLLPGQISKKIGTYVSDLWHFELGSKEVDGVKRPQYIVRTQPQAGMKLRCSFPSMPPAFNASEISHIYNALGLPTPSRPEVK
jgi:hypothetical protein